MGELGAFLRLERVGFEKRDPDERVHDYRQYFSLPDDRTLRDQGARCMDCGVPFCHEGCPLGNLIPDWNDLVYRDHWRDALAQLHATNNFPEFTGLICPAPCESACVLDINDDPVTIEQIELAIVTRGFEEGWIEPDPPELRTGRTVAVVGSGPAGPRRGRGAEQARPHGHRLRARRGARRAAALRRARRQAREVDHRPPREAARGRGRRVRVRRRRGRATSRPASCARNHDAVVVAIGSRVHRDLDVPGRELAGVHFAMDYLYQRNRSVAAIGGPRRTARRRPAARSAPRASAWSWSAAATPAWTASRTRCARAPRTCSCSTSTRRSRADGRPPGTPWPLPPKRTGTTYALDEGGERRFGTAGDRAARAWTAA